MTIQATRNAAESTTTFSASVTTLEPQESRLLLSDPIRSWRDQVVQRLNNLVALEVGWDGYKGKPVSFENANFTLHMLESACSALAPAPNIVPGPSGDLQVEWYTDAFEIELDVLSPYNVEAWYFDKRTSAAGLERRFTNDFTVVAKWIDKLVTDDAAQSAAA